MVSSESYVYFTSFPFLPFSGLLEKILRQKTVFEVEILFSHPSVWDKNENCSYIFQMLSLGHSHYPEALVCVFKKKTRSAKIQATEILLSCHPV